MNDKINLTKLDGTNISADLICFLENISTGKRYVYYTLNEVVNGNDANSTVKIYVSKVQQNNPQLDTVITEEDWGLLKGYMSDALKGNVNPQIKYIPISELVNPVSVSEKAIAMPTSYDYINKQRGIYAESVATSSDSGSTVSPVVDSQPTVDPAVAPDTLSATTTIENVLQPVNEPVTQIQPIEHPAVSEPIVENTVPPVVEQPTVQATENTQLIQSDESSDSSSGSQAVLEPINIEQIEIKYNEMIANINKLREQELEAAKRYNATIELSAMHKEQHASFVQEQVKTEPIVQTQSVVQPEVTQPIVENIIPPMDSPIATPVNPVQEPVPVTPVVPDPVAATPQNMETNWFDMPNNQ